IEIETCGAGGGTVKIIASIEDPAVINQILVHLAEKAATTRLPPSRAPPPPSFHAELSPGLSRAGRVDSLLDLHDLRLDQQADEWLDVMLAGVMPEGRGR
ncbi:MAG: hypothetical protein ACSLE2_14860, partial [Lysobacterales bacterium]